VAGRLFRGLSWAPLALLLGMQWYVRGFDGWGRWAAAPLVLLPVALSVMMVVAGGGLCRREAQAGQPFAATLIAIILAATPALWFGARLLMP
jgi:hypothetical protein